MWWLADRLALGIALLFKLTYYFDTLSFLGTVNDLVRDISTVFLLHYSNDGPTKFNII